MSKEIRSKENISGTFQPRKETKFKKTEPRPKLTGSDEKSVLFCVWSIKYEQALITMANKCFHKLNRFQ